MPLDTQLNMLESSGLIRLAATRPDLEYIFRHALMQDAAYQSLPKEDRMQLHAAVGEALERLYDYEPGEASATLAHHFEKAGVLDKAARYLTLAGDRARAGFANREALGFYQAARGHVERLRRGDAARAEKWRQNEGILCEVEGDLLELSGRHAEARASYDRAMLSLNSDERIGQSRLHRKMGYTWMMQRRHEKALRAYDEAEAGLGDGPAVPFAAWWQEWLEIQLDRMWLRYGRNDVAELSQLVERARAALEQYGTPSQRSRYFFGLVNLAYRQSCYSVTEETLANARAGFAAAQASHSINVIADAHFVIGVCYLIHGELQEAEAHLRDGLNLSERTGSVVIQARNLTYLVVTLRRLGRITEVRARVAEAMSVVAAGQMWEYLATAQANMAWIAYREGDLAWAREQSQAALQIWRELPLVYPFTWTALWPLLGVAIAEGRLADAVEHARALLAPGQQRLPERVALTLEAVVLADTKSQPEKVHSLLDQAVSQARVEGYL